MPERIIVNYGVYQFSDEERHAYRLRLLATVIREPGNKYESVKPQKPESFYGYAQLMNGDFVHRIIRLSFSAECVFEYFNHDALNTLYGTIWQFGTVQTISNAVVSLGGSPLVLVPSDLTFFPMPYDRVVFKLFNDTTLAISTEVIALPEVQGFVPEWDEATAEPLGRSQTQPTPNPLDEPYDIGTAPYDDETDDNGETYSPQTPEPPLTGETGMYQFSITVRYLSNFDTGATAEITQSYAIPAPISRPVKTVVADTSSGYSIAARNQYSPANTVADWCVASYAGTITSQQKQEALNAYTIVNYSATPL